jgi:hypothetical protein
MKTRSILVVVALVAMTSCYYGTSGAASQGTPDNWSLIGLTNDPGDMLNVKGDLQRVDITTGENTGVNTRIAWIVDEGNFEHNEVCATWDSHTGRIDQPGLVVHFDGTHAFTMTQNIWAMDRSVINFHAWDLSKPDAPFTQVGSFRPSNIGDGFTWPIRACLRADGPFLDGKVWPADSPEPEYGDPVASGGTLITDTPGRAGWYAGHVANGETMTMTLLSEIHA